MAVKRVLGDFAGQTSAHGLGRIAGSGQLSLKLFWAFMVVGALCVCGWQISLLFFKYYSFPVEEHLKIVFGEVEFPAITACNLNRFRASQQELGGESFVALIEQFGEALAKSSESSKKRKKRSLNFNIFHHADCKMTIAGENYNGTHSKTVSGLVCQAWNRQTPHKHRERISKFPDSRMRDASNHCRNPGAVRSGPWCYTTDPEVTWELCDVALCPDAAEEITESTVQKRDTGEVTTDAPDTGSTPSSTTNNDDANPDDSSADGENPDTDSGSTSEATDQTTVMAAYGLTNSATPPPYTTLPPEIPPLVFSSPEKDPSNSYFLPKVDLTDKPWLKDQGEPDPFVKNAELLGAALRAVPVAAQRAMGYQVDSLMLDCVYNGKQCGPANFTGFSNIFYGNCFTFNSGLISPLLWAKKQGSMYGLTLTVFVDQDEYISALTPAAGLRVLLHTPDVQPFPEDGGGFDVGPGQKASVAIRVRKTNRMPDPYSNCTYGEGIKSFYEGNYSIAACQRTCQQLLFNETCGCGDPTLPIVNGLEVCGKSDDLCVYFVKEALEHGDLSCDSKCPEPCRVTEYLPSVAAAEWPGDAIITSIKDKYSERDPHLAHSLQQLGGVKKNLLKLEFFFDELRYEEITYFPAYGIESFLGDIGGQLGLWIGMSVLTILEFFQLFIDIGRFCCSSNDRNGYDDMEDGDGGTSETPN